MIKPRFSLASLMLSVLFIGAICAAIIYARRGAKLQRERDAMERERNAIATAKQQEIQALEDQAEALDAQKYAIETAFQEFRSKADADKVEFQAFQTRVASLLAEAMKDEVPAVRQWAARTLGQIGPGTKEALAGLEGLLDDDDDEVRKAAAAAVARINQGPASQTPAAREE